LIVFSACGGGGGGGSAAVPAAAHAPQPVTTPTAGPAGFAKVSFSIALPAGAASTARRTPQFVPASTTSISISINGTTPQIFPCTSGGCSGSFLAPAGGSVNFLFAAVDASSNVLANAPVTQTIAANGTNTIAVTLNGVVAGVTLNATPAGLNSAASGSSTVSASAVDADGDPITGTYSAPVVVSTTDTTGTIAVTGATLASSTSTATLTYTHSAATQYVDNHFGVKQTSATETTAQPFLQFVVGRTFYTFVPTAVLGFAPGSTTPTRTIAMPSFSGVSSLACDGTNLYVLDDVQGAVYGIAPGATAPVNYTSSLFNPDWVAANDIPAGTSAQFYVANADGGPAMAGFQGPPGFTLPPNVAAQTAAAGSFGPLQVDGSGNVYAAMGGYEDEYGGYAVYNPALSSVLGSGSNVNGTASIQIAVDTHSAPTIRIYTEESSFSNGLPEISEYDNLAASPSYVSPNSDGFGLFVDSNGLIYVNVGLVQAGSHARRGAEAVRRRALQYSGTGIFDVYAQGGLAGSFLYSFPGLSVAFDSENYVYDLTAAGSITIYQPGGTTVVGTIPVPPAYVTAGDTFGDPASLPFEFGTFCQ
jgi:hypothetical protein